MPFIKNTYFIKTPIKAFLFLKRHLNYSMQQAQRLINRGRVSVNGEVLQGIDKAKEIVGKIEVYEFVPQSRGNAPIYENEDFAVFNKPSNVPSHPKGLFAHYSLLDEVYHYCGMQSALIHRLDTQTSGLILVGKHKKSIRELGKIFMDRKVYKEYIAQVKVSSNTTMPYGKFCVCAGILMGDTQKDLGVRVQIFPFWQKNVKGLKFALSEFEFIGIKKNTATLRAIPITGRTHQLRAHLAYIGFPIVNDFLYGVSDEVAREFLELSLEQQFQKEKLQLCATILRFEYHKKSYEFSLTQDNLR